MAFRNLLGRVFDANERELRRLQPTVDAINQLESEYEQFSKQELAQTTDKLIDRMRSGKDLDDILVDAYAAVRESAKRYVGLRHYDVQLMGGILLHSGRIVEMKTGEGKTLVATLPLFLNALRLDGVHLITPNDYLSKVGVQWMGPVYHHLGMSVSVIQSARAETAGGSFLFDPDYISDDARYQNLRPCTRQEAYNAHITYGTNHEFGFDYLRDNMVYEMRNKVQRELNYAIIDEIDNILIDEARTPLIISGPSDEASPYYAVFARMVRSLKPSSEQSIEDEQPDGDYVLEIRTRNAYLTESGIEKIQSMLDIENLYGDEHAEKLPYLDNALRAYVVFSRDRDYVVQKGEIVIVDDFTGRMMYGRRYSEGLHQAIEAKEGVRIQRENLTHATITYQNFFRMYNKLSGMTGTAATEAEEFSKIYDLDVSVLPTNIEYNARIGSLTTERGIQDGAELVTYRSPEGSDRYFKRLDYPDVIYSTEKDKFNSVVDEIEAMQSQGRPVLVGTAAIETSEKISAMLERRNIGHQVLNAKRHAYEAYIVAQAGRKGTVTIATNMAGRGVDILLGGNPEGLARENLRRQGIELTEATEDQWRDSLEDAKTVCANERELIWSHGGLHVVGTERHEARRIDNQLRGRAGRQGDPGSSRFFLSLEDDLFRRFGGERLKGFLQSSMGDAPIELGLISRSIEQAQTRVEGYNFDIRKRVLDYDQVVNEQRSVIYSQRSRVIELDDLADTVLEMAEGTINELVASFSEKGEVEWDSDALTQAVRAIFPKADVTEIIADPDYDTLDRLRDHLIKMAATVYDENRKAIGRDVMRLLRNETRRMSQLAAAESTPGLFTMLVESVPQYLPDDVWQRVEETAVSYISREDKELLAAAIARVLTNHRDRSIILRAVDSLWVRHLTDLDILREGIGLRAVAQQDPLVAYQREAHEMYTSMLGRIQHDVVHQVFRPIALRMVSAPRPSRQLTTNVDASESKGGTKRSRKAPGRNDPCPCGSGKKYKNCCMRSDRSSTGSGAGDSSSSAKPRMRRKKR